MDDIQFRLDTKGHGGFYLMDGDEQIGEMAISIDGNNMTVHHTEISPATEGKGLGKKLLAAMVAHARKEGLQVTPLCAFVHAQFRRHQQEYADIWKP